MVGRSTNQPGVARRLDVPPAVLRQLAVSNPRRYPALLESAVAGPLGQVTILAAQPQAVMWSSVTGRAHGRGVEPRAEKFLDALEIWWQQSAGAATAHHGVPFAPGWVIFLGYEVAAEIEPHLTLPPTPLPWTAFALRTPCALVHVLDSDAVWAVAEPGMEGLLDEVVIDALGAGTASHDPGAIAFDVIEEDPALYIGRVLRAQEYIRRRYLPGQPVTALAGTARRRTGLLGPCAGPGYRIAL
jgi:anthranilate synthase component 1